MSDADEQNEPVVAYKVRELLVGLGRDIGDLRREMTDKLDLLFSRLDGKADKADVAGLATKVEAVDQRLHHVEQAELARERDAEKETEAREQATQARRWLLPLVLSAAVLIVMAAGLYLQWQVAQKGHP